MHTGPFGNIATGKSSIVADLIGIRTGDYLITEAGFGADIGAEKFFDMKCRMSGLAPDAAVVVATVRALKAHSGRHTIKPGKPLPAGAAGGEPRRGRDRWRQPPQAPREPQEFGVTPVVAINAFPDRPPRRARRHRARSPPRPARGRPCRTHVVDGGAGAVDLAGSSRRPPSEPNDFRFLYPEDAASRRRSRRSRPRCTAPTASTSRRRPPPSREVRAQRATGTCRSCIAKTHLSITSRREPARRAHGWPLPVRELRAARCRLRLRRSAVTIRTMPGLSSHPAAERIDIDADGNIVGLS